MADEREHPEAEISDLLVEDRRFAPSAEFAKNAYIRDGRIRDKADEDPEQFWANAASGLHWFKQWDKVLQWDPPHAQWFVGGKLNASYNCCDRHILAGQRNKAAIIWEGEPGDTRVLTYWGLYREVNLFANALKGLGVKKGDRVAIYLPMIPEAVVAMLACARIGAIHSVVFGGFSAEALRDRINDSQCKVLITADGEEGVRLAKQQRPDVILLDWMMPGKNGFEACQEMRQVESLRDVPILVLTAFGQHIGEIYGLGGDKAGYVQDCLEKPVEINVLLERLDKALHAAGRNGKECPA